MHIVLLKSEAPEFTHGLTRTSTLLCVAVNISTRQQYPSLPRCRVRRELLGPIWETARPPDLLPSTLFTNFHIIRLNVPQGWAWPLSSLPCRPSSYPTRFIQSLFSICRHSCSHRFWLGKGVCSDCDTPMRPCEKRTLVGHSEDAD